MQENDLIKRNVETVRGRIEAACRAAGRSPREVELCAVTKYVGAEQMRALLEAGVSLIGENRVQAAAKKIRDLGRRDFKFHMIGHLQSNKAADAAALFDAVQSVDSLKLARILNAEAGKQNRALEVYLQVNSSGESSKSGVAPGEFMDLAKRVLECEHLHLTGVMTIGPLTQNQAAVRDAFSRTKSLYEELRAISPEVVNLSMGMSGDLEIAIDLGATQVRVGSALYEGV
jgi:pyridoxal phosphate enzyme (YggS family)